MIFTSLEQAGYAALAVAVMGFFLFMAARAGVFGIPPFLKPRNRPAVYLARSRSDPQLVKAGYTSRKVETRIRELEARSGHNLELIVFVRMPHAWHAEQRFHTSMLASGWQVPASAGLGIEWYHVPSGRIGDVVDLLVRDSEKTERHAKRVWSWPHKARRAIYWPSL